MAARKTRQAIEFTDPEKFADFFIRYAEDPEPNIAAICREVGLSHQVGSLMAKRLETRYLPALKEVEKVTSKSLIKGLEKALPLAMARLCDSELIGKAGYRELSTGIGIMIEKRQLLLGEPTQIMSLEERKSLKEIAPGLIAEIERRGQKPVEVEFEEVLPIDVTQHSKTAKHQVRKEDRGRV